MGGLHKNSTKVTGCSLDLICLGSSGGHVWSRQ